MWESYHPLKLAKSMPPDKYCIGYVRDYVDFYSWDGDFYDTLKERVEAFLPRKLRRYDPRMYFKTAVVLISWTLGMIGYFYFFNIPAALFYAFACGQIGVNIMHDGNHMAFSRNFSY